VTQNYGGSFAQKLIDQGRYEEAVTSATREVERDREDPEPLVDRATALTALGRFADALTDLEKALALDEVAQVLETDFVDDALFEAVVGDARAQASQVADAVARLGRYRTLFPRGRHLVDLERCAAQLRGERDDSPIVKEREA
jgi:tetratricopeptide (TPR) repeat protein